MSQDGFQLVINVTSLLKGLHYELKAQTLKKTSQFQVILNSKNPFQLLIQPSSRPPGAFHQPSCEPGFHTASTPHELAKWKPKALTYLGLGSSLPGLYLFKTVPISRVALIANLNSYFVGSAYFFGWWWLFLNPKAIQLLYIASFDF